mmetsp:Transcript_28019/g.91603  ORF Transcript_28019/g.91603 Transcript_28019/m.91603 type:complete len:255 (-) Transcript_28019:173-937(-)
MVRDGIRGPDHQSVGPRVRAAQADADGAHRASDGARGELEAPVHVLVRARQNGQVLGPRVQQSDPALPRAPLRRLLPRAAPRARHPLHGRARLDVPRVGHAHEAANLLPLRPRKHRLLHHRAEARPAGDHRRPRLHHQAVGPCRGQDDEHPHLPQKGDPSDGDAPNRVFLRVGVGGQHQKVSAPDRRLSPQHAQQPKVHRQHARAQQRQRPHVRRGQRLHVVLGLEVGALLPARADARTARVPRVRGGHLRLHL